MNKSKTNIYVATIIVVAAGLLAFSYYTNNNGTDKNNLPSYALRNSQVKEAYVFASENKDLLSHIPCYCGCGNIGHESAYNCFIKEEKSDGNIEWEEHGSGCGTCYNIALDSKKLLEQGKPASEIRDYIDNKYSQYGNPTNTPKP